ncbi:MAG: class I SAM-dependent methyltransferase [Mycobacteriales bacterium]
MTSMLDEERRRQKARKIIAVLRHFLGRDDLAALRVLDLGCSAGFIADELASAGAEVFGIDIDVPGLTRAKSRFGTRVRFVCTDGSRLPWPDASVDVVNFNHIYEHVVDPAAVVAEIHRVLRPGAVVYLGLGNRLGVIEPHYRLPFLSWLPPAAADRYLRASGRADHYHERFYARGGLRRLFAAFTVWDYSLSLLREPQRFAAGDVVPSWSARLPLAPLKAARPLLPAYVWVAVRGTGRPTGPPLRYGPERLN